MSIQGQISVVVIVCLVIVIFAGSMLERWVLSDNDSPHLEALSQRAAAIAYALSMAKPEERDALVTLYNRGRWQISLEPISIADEFTSSSTNEPLIHRTIDWVFPPESGTVPHGGWRTFYRGQRVIAAKVDDDEILLAPLPERLLRGDAVGSGSNFLVALVTLIVIFSSFAVWAITRPLRRIAFAATRADIQSGPAPFEERGSTEIVALARALNGMQSRIATMVESRTRMLRGISHDLRTPLTRLRLRADRVQQEELRSHLINDIGQIERLLTESLSFLRDGHQREGFERADIASTLQTICDEFTDTGHDFSYQGPARLIASFKPLALTRAITNLCENSAKFGTKTDVSLSIVNGTVVIEIADNGPGIPPDQLSRVVEPFYKVDTSRSGKDCGFGLGLSIVLEIAQSHNGSLELAERRPSGLIARLRIPVEQ